MIQRQSISYSEAQTTIKFLIDKMAGQQKSGVVAIVDEHGELIAFARMDDAPLSSITIAINKAYSAARERKPSKEIGLAARKPDGGFDIGYFGDPRFTGWGGGVPVWKDGRVVGAVAISGLPQVEDMELAAWAAQLLECSAEAKGGKL